VVLDGNIKMINKIQLKNFQKHSFLELDFSKSINIITGLSNVGKSCIRRAIEFVCFGTNISLSDIIKEGESQVSVKIYLDNNITIERLRSSTVNRYILKHNDDEKVFDSIGKNLPEEIQKVLNLSEIEIEDNKLNLNIASQLVLPFLLDKSATFRAKLFNKLTGNELLDKLFKEFNKESLRFNREIKETEENIVKQEEQLTEYSIEYKNIKNKAIAIREHYNKIKEDVEIYEHLSKLCEELKGIEKLTEIANIKKSTIKIISDEKIVELKEKAEQLNTLNKLYTELTVLNKSLLDTQEKQKSIKIVDVDFQTLQDKNDNIKHLLQLNTELVDNKKQEINLINKIQETTNNLIKTEEELHNIWQETDTCPLCGLEKNKCHIEEIK
jgi:exonuclease SbcC